MTVGQITRLEVIALRTLMLVMAALTALGGVVLLTTPLAIPAVVGLWLGAAAMFVLGLWGTLPDDGRKA
jgi:hypothetical protein